MPGYKVSDFEDGKLITVEVKHLNPKFQIGAFNVDAIEEADQKLMNEFVGKSEWNSVNNGASGEYYSNNIIKFRQWNPK